MTNDEVVLRRSADIPVRSKPRTFDDSGCSKSHDPLARCCGQECPRSGGWRIWHHAFFAVAGAEAGMTTGVEG